MGVPDQYSMSEGTSVPASLPSPVVKSVAATSATQDASADARNR